MSQYIKTVWNRMRAEYLPPLEEIESFGADGEEAIYRLLCKHFECVIRNVVVPHKKLYLEKDFLVIHKNVPFVIEVKNWKGEIGCKNGEFYQNKENGVHKTLKSPVGTTKQFMEKMRAFYKMDTPLCGVVIFAEPDCRVTLPEEMDGIALLTPQKAITYIKNRANKLKQKELFCDPSQILHCTRFYSRNSEFCKGMMADYFFDCETKDGAIVRVDTTSLAYISVHSQPLRARDKLFITFMNGESDVFYNRDTVFDVVCLDGTCQKIALHRVRHIVF
ncbi:MAG: NERD domain-containing protein [Clostridia bacterium]|nr:NERD domain-containing protein [Clostridia bacterium]